MSQPHTRTLDLLPPPGAVDPTAPALWTALGPILSHATLRAAVETAAEALVRGEKRLVPITMTPDPATVIAYLGALAAGHAVLALDGGRAGNAPGMPAWVDALECRQPLHPELALVLPTSGTTGGGGKLARLSYANLAANTQAIVRALELGPGDRVAAHLPLGFAFGLSVLHTYLAAGGCVALIEGGFTSADFWRDVRAAGCTALPGVPYHLETLVRLGVERVGGPALTTVLQAGGRCAPDVLRRLDEGVAARGGRVFSMYGQTEAGPRMAILPAGELRARAGSVGPALPGGRFEILGPDGAPLAPGEEGEIVYWGPNVMLGYAEVSDLWAPDLSAGDRLGGRLATGDLGRIEADGYLTITGRLKRIAKVYGLRLSLDGIEALAAEMTAPATPELAAIELGGRVLVVVVDTEAAAAALRARLLERLGLPRAALACVARAELPRLVGGKPDYRRLAAAEA